MSAPIQKKRRILLISALVLLAAFPAAAASYEDALLGQLRGLGFSRISVEHTLLGRTRLLAERADGTRENILDPRTGEILRDLWIAVDGSVGNGGLIDNSGDVGSDDNGSDDNDGGGNSGPGGDGGDDD